jgi:hypothetical protein
MLTDIWEELYGSIFRIQVVLGAGASRLLQNVSASLPTDPHHIPGNFTHQELPIYISITLTAVIIQYFL